MFQFITKLFAAPTSPKNAPKVRLSVETMEDRSVPAVVTNLGSLSGYDTRALNIEGGWVSVAETRGFVIEGGLEIRGFIIQGG